MLDNALPLPLAFEWISNGFSYTSSLANVIFFFLTYFPFSNTEWNVTRHGVQRREKPPEHLYRCQILVGLNAKKKKKKSPRLDGYIKSSIQFFFLFCSMNETQLKKSRTDPHGKTLFWLRDHDIFMWSLTMIRNMFSSPDHHGLLISREDCEVFLVCIL